MNVSSRRAALLTALAAFIAGTVEIGVTYGDSGSPTSTIYRACLGGGVLYGVTTDGSTPTCKRGAQIVAWNQIGPQGPAGLSGASILNGTGAPTNGAGSEGDFYLDTSSHTLYGPKASGAWPTSGTSLVGPPGADGTNGTNGTNGNTLLNGAGAPSDPSLGNAGDFYLDTNDHMLYGPKTASGWPSSGVDLVGPSGPSGDTGDYEAVSSGQVAMDQELDQIAIMEVPPGDYLVLVSGQVENPRVSTSQDSAPANVDCVVSSSVTSEKVVVRATVPGSWSGQTGTTPFAGQGRFALSNPTPDVPGVTVPISLTCTGPSSVTVSGTLDGLPVTNLN